jgi:Protein of unknown function (DUF2950)
MSRGASTQRSRFYAAAICMLLWFWPAFGVWADRQSVRQGYASPEEAAAALVSAARSHDQATLSEIFGTGSEKLLSSGDRYVDEEQQRRLADAYNGSIHLCLRVRSVWSFVSATTIGRCRY